MSRLVRIAVALTGGGIFLLALPAAPAHAVSGPPSFLTGRLGIEGGPYPGQFYPTSGSVEVEFESQPLVLDKPVGSSGHFRIHLVPGQYTVIGCGPSSSANQPSQQCGKPKMVTLKSGEVDRITLIWAYAP